MTNESKEKVLQYIFNNDPLGILNDNLPTELIHTGGGCWVRPVQLSEKRVAIISDDYISIYASLDDFLDCEGDKMLQGFSIK